MKLGLNNEQEITSLIEQSLNNSEGKAEDELEFLSPVVGCRLEDDERDDREVVLEPRARQPPCCDASECLFSRNPSRAAGEFLYQSGTLSRCRDLCTLSSCSLGTRSPTFCSSFSGGCNDKPIDALIYLQFILISRDLA